MWPPCGLDRDLCSQPLAGPQTAVPRRGIERGRRREREVRDRDESESRKPRPHALSSTTKLGVPCRATAIENGLCVIHSGRVDAREIGRKAEVEEGQGGLVPRESGIPQGTIARWVAKAREPERGFLPQTEAGKVGVVDAS